MIELRVEVVPPWPFRLGGGSADGLMGLSGRSQRIATGLAPVLGYKRLVIGDSTGS